MYVIYGYVLQVAFSVALFVNAILFIPQAMKIVKAKNSQSVSLMTYVGFIVIQFVCMLYGIHIKDWILTYGFFVAMLTCMSVVFVVVVYR